MGFLKKITGKVFASSAQRGARAASDICFAAEQGDVKKLQKLFKGTSYTESGTIADYALLCAAEQGQLETARFLLEFGVPPDIEVRGGETPVRAACRNGHVEILALMHDYVVQGGGRPAPLLVEAVREMEKKRRQQAVADAPNAAVLQRNIKTRKKPLNFKSKKS